MSPSNHVLTASTALISRRQRQELPITPRNSLFPRLHLALSCDIECARFTTAMRWEARALRKRRVYWLHRGNTRETRPRQKAAKNNSLNCVGKFWKLIYMFSGTWLHIYSIKRNPRCISAPFAAVLFSTLVPFISLALPSAIAPNMHLWTQLQPQAFKKILESKVIILINK